MSTSAQLCLEWTWFQVTRLLIIIPGIGAYGPEPPAALVAKTQTVLAKKLGRKVSEQEARVVIREFKNFLALLKEIRHGK